MVQYRTLRENEICRELFRGFIRHQAVTKCWRREKGEWVIREDPFIDDWTEADYRTLISCLKNTVATGGVVYGAFIAGTLKGFTSVEPDFMGKEGQYLDLSSIHVSEDARETGSGEPCFSWRRSGPGGGERKSCTSPPIPLWRPRRFTGAWGVWRRWNMTGAMWTKSPLTVRWSVCYEC